MQLAKDKVQSILTIACSSIDGQAFHLGVAAFPSQAKRTLDCYSGGYQSEGGASSGYCSDGGYRSDKSSRFCNSRELGQWDKCFGCKMIHLLMKNGEVVSPNAGKPGVPVAAQATYEEQLQKTKTRGKNKKLNHSVEFDKLSNASKVKMKEAVIATMNICTQLDASPGNGSAVARDPHKKPLILVADVIDLSLARGSHD